MEVLQIQETEDTPSVVFNPGKNIYAITGRSLPEDSIAFYSPVFDWLESYFDNSNNKDRLVFEFKLDYFNTASAKQLSKLFKFLESKSDNFNIGVNWYYKEDDEDTYITGERYARILDLDFELIAY